MISGKGKLDSLEDLPNRRGEKPSFLGGQERVGCDGQAAVMVKTSPGPSLEMVHHMAQLSAALSFQLLGIVGPEFHPHDRPVRSSLEDHWFPDGVVTEATWNRDPEPVLAIWDQADHTVQWFVCLGIDNDQIAVQNAYIRLPPQIAVAAYEPDPCRIGLEHGLRGWRVAE